MTVKLPHRPFYDHFVEELDKLQSANGLKQHKMSLCEFHMIYAACKEMFTGREAETISQKVANWFKKNGFVVSEHGIGWRIVLPENEKKGIVVKK